MRKLNLPDKFKKKGRLAYYTLAHKTGAMVLVGFYLDNSIDPNSFFVNYFAQCLYAPFSTYNFSLGGAGSALIVILIECLNFKTN